MNREKKLKYCANGEWKVSETKKYMPITNSSTGEVIAEAPCCTVDEVNEAVSAAKKAFPTWSTTPIGKRVQVMFKFKDLLEVHIEELTRLIATELGKNMEESRGDIIKAIEVVELA